MATNHEDFLAKRKEFLQQQKERNLSNAIPFDENEKKAAKVFKRLKIDVEQVNKVNLMNNLLDNLPLFKDTKLFEALRRMPKGVLQHIHLPTAVSLDSFIKIFGSRDDVFYSPEKRQFAVFGKNSVEEGYISVTAYRNQNGDEQFASEVSNKILINKQEMYSPNVEEIFAKFDERFFYMSNVFYYEPILKTFLETSTKEIQSGGYDAAEIRSIGGLFMNSDSSKGTDEQELAFLKSFKERQRQENPNFFTNFIHTGIKIKDMKAEQVDQWLKFYKTAISSEEYKDIIAGFDMVSYEGNVMLQDMAEELLKFKQEYPQAKFVFHAGESVSIKNQNILDAVLLGSKRIGHGITIDRSSRIMHLVKKNDICVETNPVSNYILGFMRDPFWHPIRAFINDGVHFTINSDDFLLWDTPAGSMDYLVASIYSDLSLKEIKWTILNSIKFSLFDETTVKKLNESFEKKWHEFIGYLNSDKI